MGPSRAKAPRRTACRALVAAVVVASTVGAADYAGAAVTTTRVSVRSDGSEATGGFLSSQPSLSGDGRLVAFTSSSTNLVPGDTNEAADVFVHDRTTRVTTRISVGPGGVEGNSASTFPAMSANGRFVTFASAATNLVVGDTNGQSDVFVHDRQGGTTSRVSVVTGGAQGCTPAGTPATCAGAGASLAPTISADGRFVAFQSAATYLATGTPAGDTNGVVDVFVHDRQTTTTSRISVVTGGAQGCTPAGGACAGAGASTVPAISADGRVVAFTSAATYLATGTTAGDTNGALDVFVHDRETTTTSRVSVATGGAQANGASNPSSISADGRLVAFASEAANLVAGDTNAVTDVFVHDRSGGATRRVSVATGGAQVSGGPSSFPSISGDGRVVTFDSASPGLVAGDTNGVSDVFHHDRATATTTRVSVANGGAQGNGGSFFPDVSDDGRFVTYSSEATNLVVGDTNAAPDIFVADRLAPEPPGTGYRLVASDGGIFAFGDARFHGSTGALVLNRPIVAMAATPSGNGYWLAAADGGIFAFGDARFHGSTGALRLNRPIVAMAATPSGNGYWLAAADGGIFAFGDARFHGSTGALRLNQPIVAMAATRSGNGYWLAAADGGIFAFGGAAFAGSTGGVRLNQPIVGMAGGTGAGYWLVARDGGIFAFGGAQFFGSTGAIRLNQPIVAMAGTPAGRGYWLTASDGGVFAFGDAGFFGSTGALALNRPIVGMAGV